MDQEINCFWWKNHVSDILDNSLEFEVQEKADFHLENCKHCREHLKHFRSITNSLSDLPSQTIPKDLKQSLQKKRVPLWRLRGVPHWKHFPWYVRIPTQSFLIVCVVLFTVAIAPRLKEAYQHARTSPLDSLDAPFLTENVVDSNPNEEAATPGSPSVSDGATEAPNAGLLVRRSPLWRFTIKTVSPDDFIHHIEKILTELEPDARINTNGMQVPGGVEFSVVLEEDIALELKLALQDLASEVIPDEDERKKNFSWYRVLSRQKIPKGKSRVVIWLAQPSS